MMKDIKLALLAALLIPGAALERANVGDAHGSTNAAIRAALEAQGYTVSELKLETDQIEVDAGAAGQSFKIDISPTTGKVLAVEEDDEDEDDT